jgi:hypothetical protein
MWSQSSSAVLNWERSAARIVAANPLTASKNPIEAFIRERLYQRLAHGNIGAREEEQSRAATGCAI